MPFHAWKPKPSRPVLNRANGLCRGLIFASAPGWTYGFTNGTIQTDPDEYLRLRGVWNASPLNASPWTSGNESGGRGIDNGDGSFTAAPEWLIPAGDTRYDITRGWSAAVLVRPDILSTDVNIPLFKRRDQPYGATDPGWHFSAGAGNTWRVEICDGAAEASCVGTTTQNTVRGDMLVATYDRTTLRLYVNGALEASTATGIAVGNSAAAIKILGLGTAGAGQPNYSGMVSLGLVWKRQISNAEIGALYARPWDMWTLPEEPEGIGGSFQSYMLVF